MQDPKKSSSIFSFSKAQRRFIVICGIFLLPVVLGYAFLEYAVRQIPNDYSIIGSYLDNNKKDIEVAIFGSSQIKNAINPEFIEKNTINFSSTSQHHNSDFEILKQTQDRMPNLKTVVYEVSFTHFEIPHNSKYFWKNSPYLIYYDVNAFGRTTYWPDRLLFLSNTGVFSEELISHVKKDSSDIKFNKFAFEVHHYEGKFQRLGYDNVKIMNSNVKISDREDLRTFKYNVDYFYKMMDFAETENLNVVIISPPTYSNYNNLRNPNILRRRDSILELVSKKYKNVYFLNEEQNDIFTAKDFRNENHLNPDGAKKFTLKLNAVLNHIQD